MKLIDYIRGERRGAGARGLELDALKDPFLCEALRGYDACGGTGNDCIKALAGIDQDLSRRSFARRRRWLLWLTVGVLALALICLAFFMLVGKSRQSDNVTPPAVENTEAAPVAAIPDASPVPGTAEDGDTDNIAEETGESVPAMPETEEPASAVEENDKPEAPAKDNDIKTAGGAKDTPANGQESASVAAPPVFAITPPDAEQAAYVAHGMKYLSVPAVGQQKFNEYLRRAMALPEDGERGEVAVSFRVNRYGRPSEIRIERSFFQPAGREAIRLLESGPEWTPTDQRVEVTFFFRDK